MDEKKSFIPKKKYTSVGKSTYKKPGLGLVMSVSVFLFLFSLVFLGGVLGYKRVVSNQLDDLFISVERAKASFDPEFILELDKLSEDIVVVEDLVSKHRTPSKIFDILEKFTIKDMSFDEFDFTYFFPVKQQARVGVPNQNISESLTVSLKGETKDFITLSQQAEVFKVVDVIESFSFSNLSLTQEGRVSFNLEIMFKKSIYD